MHQPQATLILAYATMSDDSLNTIGCNSSSLFVVVRNNLLLMDGAENPIARIIELSDRSEGIFCNLSQDRALLFFFAGARIIIRTAPTNRSLKRDFRKRISAWRISTYTWQMSLKIRNRFPWIIPSLNFISHLGCARVFKMISQLSFIYYI